MKITVGSIKLNKLYKKIIMNLKQKCLKEIKKQPQNKDTEILKWFLSITKSSSEWQAFTIVQWKDNQRFWYPTDTLRKLSYGMDKK